MSEPLAPSGGSLSQSPEWLQRELASHGYLADIPLCTVAHLALSLPRPLLLEGDAGVGKTALALALAEVIGGQLIRLQCYEGLDVSQAVYEWDHARQLVHLRTAEATGELRDSTSAAVEAELYSERFLVERPLLAAISAAPGTPSPVLLIDEIDRADDEFEAFLLEVLADQAITIPELGTRRAVVSPVVILTSNRTRDLHDALKRRCLYHWVEHPSFEREVAIIGLRSRGVDDRTAREVAAMVEHFRGLGLYKPPGVSEAVDWATALSILGADLTAESAQATLGTVIKIREDRERVEAAGLTELVELARARAVG